MADKQDKAKETEKKQSHLGSLEEDDEFEEFPLDNTVCECNEADKIFWEETWDDDDIEEDFSIQLNKALQPSH